MTAACGDDKVTIGMLRDDTTIRYAAEELGKYLKMMGDVRAEIRIVSHGVPAVGATIHLGLYEDVGMLPPASDAPELDDAVHVDVACLRGVIAGLNPRSVLLGVYRFLEEAGCRWVRPGPDGELVPRRDVGDIAVALDEVPSYRHRGLCIEGAVSYQNMVDSIDWAPKVGLNSYMLEFLVPYTFFDRWYSHLNNPYKKPEHLAVETVVDFTRRLEGEMKKRGLTYHAIGHGWTCEPLGIPGLEWVPGEYEVSDQVRQYLAEVDGQRGLFEGIPLNTNLCYSNAEARRAVVDFAVRYVQEHSLIDVLHVWLADNYNNHCECENCRDTLPSDLYIKLLNEMDEAFTGRGISTRIAFIAYLELLWPPDEERLKNPDRFSLLFAPISRSYSQSYDVDTSDVSLPKYVRNRVRLPSDITENLAYLHAWQRVFEGDAFTYEYYFMWDHYFDPAYYEAAKILCADVKKLRSAGLNGMISDQTQRAYFPTGFGMYTYAKTLWDDSADFESLASDYFCAAFGAEGEACREYMAELSMLFDPPYLRGDRVLTHEHGRSDEPLTWRQRPGAESVVSQQVAERLASIPAVVDAFWPTIARNRVSDDATRAKSWEHLAHHADVAKGLALALEARAKGDADQASTLWGEVADYVQRNEDALQPVLDVYLFVATMGRLFALENIE